MACLLSGWMDLAQRAQNGKERSQLVTLPSPSKVTLLSFSELCALILLMFCYRCARCNLICLSAALQMALLLIYHACTLTYYYCAIYPPIIVAMGGVDIGGYGIFRCQVRSSSFSLQGCQRWYILLRVHVRSGAAPLFLLHASSSMAPPGGLAGSMPPLTRHSGVVLIVHSRLLPLCWQRLMKCLCNTYIQSMRCFVGLEMNPK